MLIVIWVGWQIFSIQCTAMRRDLNLSPEAAEFYQIARFFMTKDETEVFFSLKDAERIKEFTTYFWEIRDPDPYTEENEFKKEVETRFEYINRYFKEGSLPGWNTDRGRIYILLGAPDQIDQQFSTNSPNYRGYIQWYYGSSGTYLLFWDKEGFGRFQLDPFRSSLNIINSLEKAKMRLINFDESAKVLEKQIDFDLVYLAEKSVIEIQVSPANITFDEKGSNRLQCKLKIDIIFFKAMQKFEKITTVKEITVNQADILQKDAVIPIQIPYQLEKGKTRLDVMVTDMQSDFLLKRKVFTIKP
jgi:GWxTD domain-containing protein